MDIFIFWCRSNRLIFVKFLLALAGFFLFGIGRFVFVLHSYNMHLF